MSAAIGKRVRLWDEDWNLVYCSATSAQTVEEFMADHEWLNISADDGDTRWIGRLVRTEEGSLREEWDELTRLMSACFDADQWGTLTPAEWWPHGTVSR